MINWVDNIVPLVLSFLGLITAIGNCFFSRSLFKNNKIKKAVNDETVNVKTENEALKSVIKALEKYMKATEKPSNEMVKAEEAVDALNKALKKAADEEVQSSEPLNKYITKYSSNLIQEDGLLFGVCARKIPDKVEEIRKQKR